MNYMISIKNLSNKKVVLISAATAVLVNFTATAADYTAEIATASTEGTTNVTAVIVGVIGIAILGFGVNAMISWFKR
ncbi:hypothetical protein I6E72_10880 [Pseudoalteromonas sp. NSLLW24]|nr:hypothetical protein [Pseudoalteromonas sp. NSLLW24]